MKIIFIHQNFPGQFKHVAPWLAARKEHQVVAIGEKQKHSRDLPGVRHFWYETPKPATATTHHYIRDFESHIRRGQTVFRVLLKLREEGFVPDIIYVHTGWGEGLYVKEVYPEVPVLGYFEYYYHARGNDVGFDPEFPATIDDLPRIRSKNATNLLSLDLCDFGISPTRWQKSLYPEALQGKIAVIHEGIDTQKVKPLSSVKFIVPGTDLGLTIEDEVITFVNRNLEPYRGLHTFIRALPGILERRPRAHVLVIGGEGAGYGRKPPQGETHKEIYLKEVEIDHDRVHFLGRVSYSRFLEVLQISSVHIYLTYPFVLSWSMLEAMSAGCLVIGSKTAPVQEVIRDGENGFLVDFFSPEEIVRRVSEVFEHSDRMQGIRQKARRTIVDGYDLRSYCLPRQINLLNMIQYRLRPGM